MKNSKNRVIIVLTICTMFCCSSDDLPEAYPSKYLKFEMNNGTYTLALNDLSGYAIVRGYGKSIIEAINDMHRVLI